MKMRLILGLALSFTVLPTLSSRADDLFQLYWRGKAYTTNSAGQVYMMYTTEQSIINTVAQRNGVQASKLAFVYRPSKRDTAVVWAATGAFLADVYNFQPASTDVSNPSGSYTVRQAFLYDEVHGGPIGSIVGTEWLTRNATNGITNDSFIGQYQYAIPETNGVYNGWFYTGKRIVDYTHAP